MPLSLDGERVGMPPFLFLYLTRIKKIKKVLALWICLVYNKRAVTR